MTGVLFERCAGVINLVECVVLVFLINVLTKSFFQNFTSDMHQKDLKMH